MNKTIQELKAKHIKLIAKIMAINLAIKALQETCNHDWMYLGHSHGDVYYQCNKCGAEKDE